MLAFCCPAEARHQLICITARKVEVVFAAAPALVQSIMKKIRMGTVIIPADRETVGDGIDVAYFFGCPVLPCRFQQPGRGTVSDQVGIIVAKILTLAAVASLTMGL